MEIPSVAYLAVYHSEVLRFAQDDSFGNNDKTR